MPQPKAVSLPADDIAAIRKLNEEFLRCFLSRDFDGLRQKYAEDAVLMPPHSPACYGRDAAGKWMVDFPRATHFRFEYNDINGHGDLAYVRGTYFITIQPEGAPEPVEDVGKFLEICRKQPDGSWLLAIDTFNSDK
jgi:ketosteroid isomerase-like protein